MSVLQGMTESLFAETLKRIAEDVWKKKFSEAVTSLNKGHQYSQSEALARVMNDAFIEVLKRDNELRSKLEAAISEAAHEYFEKKFGAS